MRLLTFEMWEDGISIRLVRRIRSAILSLGGRPPPPLMMPIQQLS